MPDLWEALKDKLGERLNWNTFKKEIGQGFDTMPEAGMVLTPATSSKFARMLLENKELVGAEYPSGFSDATRDALAFLKTRYPTTFNKIFSFDVSGTPGVSSYNRYLKRIDIDPLLRGESSVVRDLGHELGHNVVERRYPDIFDAPDVVDLYKQRDSAERVLSSLRDTKVLGPRLEKRLDWLRDKIYSHPAETIPDKFGDTALKAFLKYKGLD